MAKDIIAEIVAEFDMVKPGEVYPSRIAVGEIVTGRIAEIGLALDCAVSREDSAAAKAAAEEEAAARAVAEKQGNAKAAGPTENKAAAPDKNK